MSERVVGIDSRVSTRVLRRAVIRLQLDKHPLKLQVIDEELRRRKALTVQKEAA